jgi:protein-tyrosine phosphatase
MLLAVAALCLAACQHGADSLPAAQRPLPAQLPAAQRLQWRHLPLQGAPNFRDLGGYLTADGRSLKWGLLYRSGALDKLDAGDKAYLERLDLKRIVDFRAPDEVEDAPDRLQPPLAAAVLHLPIGFKGLSARQFSKRILHGDTAGLHFDTLLVDANQAMVRQFSPVFRDWLHGLATDDGSPQLFHCTAGKDRTGFACALILHTLGVSDDVIAEDYLLTNRYYRRDPNNGSELPDDVKNVLGTVQASFLGAAFEAIDADYGDLETYLRDGLGLGHAERTSLESRYLQN